MKLSIDTVIKIFLYKNKQKLSYIEIINMSYLLNWYSVLIDDELYTEDFKWMTSPVCADSLELRKYLKNSENFKQEEINRLNYITDVINALPLEKIDKRNLAFIDLVFKAYQDNDIDSLINTVKSTYPFQKGIMNTIVNMKALASEYKKIAK